MPGGLLLPATARCAAALSGGPAASWAAAAAAFCCASVDDLLDLGDEREVLLRRVGELLVGRLGLRLTGAGRAAAWTSAARVFAAAVAFSCDDARLSAGSASMFARAMWVCSSHQSTCSVRSASTGTVPSA